MSPVEMTRQGAFYLHKKEYSFETFTCLPVPVKISRKPATSSKEEVIVGAEVRQNKKEICVSMFTKYCLIKFLNLFSPGSEDLLRHKKGTCYILYVGKISD